MMKSKNMTIKHKKQLLSMATTDMFFSAAQASDLVHVFAGGDVPKDNAAPATADDGVAGSTVSSSATGEDATADAASEGQGATASAPPKKKKTKGGATSGDKLDAVYSLLPRLVDPENSRDLIRQHLDESDQRRLACVERPWCFGCLCDVSRCSSVRLSTHRAYTDSSWGNLQGSRQTIPLTTTVWTCQLKQTGVYVLHSFGERCEPLLKPPLTM